MKVIKFGGSSLANATCFKRVAQIVHEHCRLGHLAVVVSAPQGVTNELVDLVESLHDCSMRKQLIESIEERLSTILEESLGLCSKMDASKTREQLDRLTFRLKRLVDGVQLLEYCPESTRAEIISVGERFSAFLVEAFLLARGHRVQAFEPQKFLTTDGRSFDPVADLSLSRQKFDDNYQRRQCLAIMPGFIGVRPDGKATTLGRNGSDYSAAVLAVCLQADEFEIWTDVDGVYNADPRLVKGAQLIDVMSHHEAMELSYFGARVLHPKTIAPLSQHRIPCRIKNTHQPDRPGTLISCENPESGVAKAITNLSDVAMINISGPGMKGMVGMASRVFSAVGRANISVIMISQSSAEYCISFCVPSSEADLAHHCLNDEFELELKSGLIEPIAIKPNLAIVTLVGDQMQQQKGIAASFFKALSQVGVNIIAIAQDSSERSISAVIRDERTDDAIKICHQNLFLQKPTIEAFIIGCGTVGRELINQIESQQPFLTERNIALKVVGIANSKRLLLNKQGIDLSHWRQELDYAEDRFSIARLNEFVSHAHLSTPVIIDCTSDEAIAMQYESFLENGFHLVTANKKANTTSYDYYERLRKVADAKQRRFLYETNVGAGLPVIDNMQGLLRAGDALLQFEGILSGSLSYIFGEIHKGLSLSEATLKARKLGYTEPNPAEDLSGLDVARKVLVIAREAGLALELCDIELEPVVPRELAEIEQADEFLRRLPEYDQLFNSRIERAIQESAQLRYIASIENDRCKVSIQSVDASHPLYSVADGENALAIHTRYYQPRPFVIRGYGAGASVTAAGLFGDLLRTLSWDQQQ